MLLPKLFGNYSREEKCEDLGFSSMDVRRFQGFLWEKIPMLSITNPTTQQETSVNSTNSGHYTTSSIKKHLEERKTNPTELVLYFKISATTALLPNTYMYQ